MIAIPAVDVAGGACVQLVGGDYRAERVRIADPVGVAARWRELGFARLHVVDLDAATGRGDNREVIAALIASGAATQVGGGLRSDEAVARVLEAGAERAIVGTRAVDDPVWLEQLADRHPGRVIVAADVRGREVLVRGWAAGSGLAVDALIERLNPLPLGGLLVTAVHREGQLEGPDLPLMTEVARHSVHPVLASGGVSTLEDLRSLDRAGLFGAVIGMALYVGTMDAARAAEEFGK